MPGSLIDLSQIDPPLPSRLVIDSITVIDWLIFVTQSAAATTHPGLAQERAARFVARLVSQRVAGLVTSTSLAEMLHFAVKSRFRAELPNFQAELRMRCPDVRRPGWEHLFKIRSDLLSGFIPGLDQIRRLMSGNNLFVLQPSDLNDIPSGRSLDDELVRTMARYSFDSSDAAILIDADRAGISAIVSSDADFRRARLDFDVYTWL
jgi:predicted nucleic acid-binding protein